MGLREVRCNSVQLEEFRASFFGLDLSIELTASCEFGDCFIAEALPAYLCTQSQVLDFCYALSASKFSQCPNCLVTVAAFNGGYHCAQVKTCFSLGDPDGMKGHVINTSQGGVKLHGPIAHGQAFLVGENNEWRFVLGA